MAKAKTELQVTGMTCQGCVRSIETKLAAIPGIEYAHVNLGAGRVTVEFDDDRAKVTQMIGSLQQIGFEATQL